MELVDFRNEIIESAKLSSWAEMNYEKEEFLRAMTAALMECEEVVDFMDCHYEGIGKRNKKIEIDGYSFDDADDSLCLFVADYTFDTEIKTITQTEIDKLFDRVIAFIEAADSGIYASWEECSPGYGLAFDLQHKLKAGAIKKIRLYIVSDRVMSDRIKTINADNYENIKIEFNVWDISRLHKVFESKGGKEKIIINFKDFSEFGLPCLKASQNNMEEYDAYLSVIPGKVLAEIYIKYGGRLLEGNVRAFLSSVGKVNTGIRNTIVNLPEMFFAYNNGIAGTALGLKTETNENGTFITEMTDFQIVNGGQTTASIANAMLNPPPGNTIASVKEKVGSIFVPMKLSVVTEERSETLIPDIARYANSQNKVNDADFFANHPFHIEMEKFSRRIMAPNQTNQQYSTKWYYERSRKQFDRDRTKGSTSEQNKFALEYPKNQKFDKVSLAKYINSYIGKPHIVSAGSQKNFMEFAQTISKKWIMDRNSFNDQFFKRAICLAILFKKVDNLVYTEKWYNGGYKANVVTYSISKFFNMLKNDTDKVLDFNKIWLRQEPTEATIQQFRIITKAIYDFLIMPSGVQNVTEWSKKAECWEKVKTIDIKILPELNRELIDKSTIKQEEYMAKAEQALTNKINSQIEVVIQGGKYWRDIFEWGDKNMFLTPTEKSLLLLAADTDRGIVPSDRQAARILEIRERLRKESYPY